MDGSAQVASDLQFTGYQASLYPRRISHYYWQHMDANAKGLPAPGWMSTSSPLRPFTDAELSLDWDDDHAGLKIFRRRRV